MFGYFVWRDSDIASSLHQKVLEYPNQMNMGLVGLGTDQHILKGGSVDSSAFEGCHVLIHGKITKCLDRPGVKIKDQLVTVIEYLKMYGDDFYEKLDGLFLIIIWNETTGQLNVYNNRYQTTTLYYGQDEDGFYFSDKLTELVKNRFSPPKVHLGSLRSFISNGFTITDQTQIQGIKKLLPSFRLKISKDQVEAFNHWHREFSFDRQKFDNLESHLDKYEHIYQDGIERFMEHHKTKQMGTLLSGGHDTSFTMIQGAKVFDRPIHGFTATFPGWAFDEGPYAKNIAEKCGGIYHEVPFVPEDLDYIVGLIRTNEEPVVGSSLPLYLCAKEASQHVDTMLAGDGGDTLWAEYYPVAEYHRYIKNLPLGMRKLIYKISKGLVRLTDWERFWELEHVASLFTENNYYDGFMRKLCTYRHFTDEFQSQLFTKDFLNQSPIARSIHEVEFNKSNFHEALIEGKLFNAFYTYQSFHTTKSMEFFGLNFFMPTINKEFMDFVTSLPLNYVNGGTTFHRLTNNKTINRRFHKMALARYLKKEEIYNRSFDIPWYNILRPRDEVLRLLELRLRRRGWFNSSFLSGIFSQFRTQNVKNYELLELKHHGYRIFTLLSMEVWATEYIDGRMTENFDQRINLEDYLAMDL